MTTTRVLAASDSMVSSAYPSKNYGGNATMQVNATPNTRHGWVFFNQPFPLGVTIVSATLRLYQSGAATGGTRVLSAQRISASWAESKINWDNRPAVAGSSVTRSLGNGAAGREWAFDVKAILQQVADGAAWYGFRISSDNATIMNLYGREQAGQYVPVLEVEYSDAPAEPTELAPSTGRSISVPRPTLRFDFNDVSGETQMQAFQLQMNTSNSFTSPAVDVTVAADQPEWTPTSDLAAGATYYWRVKVQDSIGLWSDWSDVASFARTAKAAVAITSPDVGAPLTNLASNPSLETNANGWYDHALNLTGNSYARSTLWSKSGSYSMRHVGTSGTTQVTPGIYGVVGSYVLPADGSTGYAVTAGKTYTAQGVANVVTAPPVAGSSGLFQELFFYDAGGNQLAQVNGATFGQPVTPGEHTVSVTAVAPAGAVLAQMLTVMACGAPSAPLEMFADAEMFFEGSGPIDYFDGSTAADGYASSWTGTANASTSVRTGGPGTVYTPTPTFSWTVTGQTQQAFQLFIVDPADPTTVLWTSDKITSATGSYTLPSKYKLLLSPGGKYRLVLRVWDTIAREAIPNEAAFVEMSRDFTFGTTGAVTGVSALAQTADPAGPFATLTWTRATVPDEFIITVAGKVVQHLDPADALVSGTTYSTQVRGITPRKTQVIGVAAQVGTQTSNFSTVGVLTAPEGVWLYRLDGGAAICIAGAPDPSGMVTSTADEDTAKFDPVGATNSVLITQARRGPIGDVQGTVEAADVALWDELEAIRATTLGMVRNDLARNVQIYNTVRDEADEFHGEIPVRFSYIEIR